MDQRGPALALAFLATIGTSACAMSGAARAPVQCSVEGGERLPAGSGGAAALCAEIEQAAAAAGAAGARVTVRVLSPFAMVARVTLDGRALPERRLDRSDRELDRSAFRRFAQSIASSMSPPAQR